MRQVRDDDGVIEQETGVKHMLQPPPDSGAPLLTG